MEEEETLEEGVITNESGKVRHDNIPLPIAERVMESACCAS